MVLGLGNNAIMQGKIAKNFIILLKVENSIKNALQILGRVVILLQAKKTFSRPAFLGEGKVII